MFGRKLTGRRIARWLSGRSSLSDVLRLKSADRERLVWEAYRRYEDGSVTDALRLFDLLAEFWPNRVEGPLGRSACLLAEGDFKGAETAAELALTIEPNNPHALANRVEARIGLGRVPRPNGDLASLDRLTLPDELQARVAALRARVDADLPRDTPLGPAESL